MEIDYELIYINTEEESYLTYALCAAESYRLQDLNKKVLNADIQDSIDLYTSNHETSAGQFCYLAINEKIEAALLGNLKLSKKSQGFEKDAYLIDHFLKNASFSTNANTVYKGISREREYLIFHDVKKGDRVSLRNFVSTSYSRFSALTHAKPWVCEEGEEIVSIMLRIRNAYGSPVKNNDEMEFLIGATAEFEVDNISYETWRSPAYKDVDLKVISVSQM